jgi:hypothetical protein
VHGVLSGSMRQVHIGAASAACTWRGRGLRSPHQSPLDCPATATHTMLFFHFRTFHHSRLIRAHAKNALCQFMSALDPRLLKFIPVTARDDAVCTACDRNSKLNPRLTGKKLVCRGVEMGSLTRGAYATCGAVT